MNCFFNPARNEIVHIESRNGTSPFTWIILLLSRRKHHQWLEYKNNKTPDNNIVNCSFQCIRQPASQHSYVMLFKSVLHNYSKSNVDQQNNGVKNTLMMTLLTRHLLDKFGLRPTIKFLNKMRFKS